MNKSEWTIAVGVTILSLIAILLLLSFRVTTMSASSMNPNLSTGDIVFINKWGFSFFEKAGITSQIKRGHIYVIKAPNKDRNYVKRVIGMPNDIIKVDNDKISVNGKLLRFEEISNSRGFQIGTETNELSSYLIQKITTRPYPHRNELRLKEGEYYMLGDNRDNSADSRFFGAIPRENFQGKIIHVVKQTTVQN